jgi:hypothetical protein
VRFPGFIGPSYTLQSVNVDCQRCLGWYPELDEIGTGKEREVASLVGVPGRRLLATIGAGPIRGEYTASTGVLYVVSGNKLYRVDSSWSETLIGTLGTSSGPVSMADNGIQLFVVDGSIQGYWVTLSTDSFTTVGSADNFLGADQVSFIDGYFIFNKLDSEQFFIAGPNSVTFDPSDISTAEGSPDSLIGHINDSRYLYLIGTESLETFWDSGNADFPFERLQGAMLPIGTEAPFSIQRFNGGIAFLGQDERGRGSVYQVQGLQPKRISTHAIEKVIAGLGSQALARAWSYRDSGHEFYCLNPYGSSTTWVYDASTSLWHERASLSNGALFRERSDCHAFAYNTNVVGDFDSGNIYALESAVYDDNGDEIPRVRTAPHVSNDMNRVRHNRFQLDMETGVGLDGSTSAIGYDPQMILDWSDDGGLTWSNEHWRSIGKLGKRKTRLIWNRLGQSRDRVYRLRQTDPVKSTLIGVELDVEEDAS